MSAAPPRNLIVLSDGTGNSAAKLFRTNVWRLYEGLDRSGGDQIAYYDDGVGTSSFTWLALLGGAFGWGLKRNVRDLYTFLCDNYRSGDRIYAFGFSRGAFTIRILMGLIANQGLIRGVQGADLQRLAKWAYREYRRNRNYTVKSGFVRPLRWLRDRALRTFDRIRGRKRYDSSKNTKADIEFAGLFDTVDAYGLPVAELTAGWDRWVWPLSMRDRRLSSRVKKACQALALDDERHTFHPLLWDESNEPPRTVDCVSAERISQVWFAGVHSNVGGGYPDDDLAYIPLVWIAEEAMASGLKLRPSTLEEWTRRVHGFGRRYDSRRGFAAYYRYSPRRLAELCAAPSVTIAMPKIHHSVLDRVKDGSDGYAPLVLPQNYEIVDATGAILGPGANPYEAPPQANARCVAQEAAWDLVWWRRAVYFLTIGTSIFFGVLPWLKPDSEVLAESAPLLSDAIRLVLGSLPLVGDTEWAAYYPAYPIRALVLTTIIAILLFAGSSLAQTIADRMRRCWAGAQIGAPATGPSLVFRLRNDAAYQASVAFWTGRVVPSGFGVLALSLMLLVVTGTGNRLAFEATSAFGGVCHITALPPAASLTETRRSWTTKLPNRAICHDTGITVERGRRYFVTVELPVRPGELWADGSHPVTSPVGLATSAAWGFYPGLPFRRFLSAKWLAPIAKIGPTGLQYHVLDAHETFVVPRTSGRVFLFVNDALLPWPWWDSLYSNNRGSPAKVTITEVADAPDVEGEP